MCVPHMVGWLHANVLYLWHELIGSLSHYLQVFIHSRWLFGISEPSTVVLTCGFGFLLEGQGWSSADICSWNPPATARVYFPKHFRVHVRALVDVPSMLHWPQGESILCWYIEMLLHHLVSVFFSQGRPRLQEELCLSQSLFWGGGWIYQIEHHLQYSQ